MHRSLHPATPPSRTSTVQTRYVLAKFSQRIELVAITMDNPKVGTKFKRERNIEWDIIKVFTPREEEVLKALACLMTHADVMGLFSVK